MSDCKLFSVTILKENRGSFYNINVLALKSEAILTAREHLDHLTEHKDYFFVETGYMVVEVFFVKKSEAVLFKLKFS